MEINRLRQLAGMSTQSKPIVTEGFDSLRKLAGINTPSTVQSVASSSSIANDIRRLAGLPTVKVIPEAEEPTETTPPAAEETPPEDASTETAPEEDQPAIIKKIAKHLEGKTVEEIEAMLMKVYDAGKADAEKAEEETEEVPTEKTEPESSESEEIGLEPGEE